jgi:DNA repair photolyase
MSKLREMHGGRDYDPRWGHRMRGEGEYAALIAKRFTVAVKRLGLATRTSALRADLFERPPQAGDQLALF